MSSISECECSVTGTRLPLDEFEPYRSLDSDLRRRGQGLSVFSGITLYAWAEHMSVSISEDREARYVWGHEDGGIYLVFPPLGRAPVSSAWFHAFELMKSVNGNKNSTRIQFCPLRDADVCESHDWLTKRFGSELLVSRSEAAALKGNRFKTKRWEVNRFCRSRDFRYRPYEPEDEAACCHLQKKWMETKRKKGVSALADEMLEISLSVHRRLRALPESTGVVKRVLEVGGRIVAYTVGYPLTKNVFCVAMEVACSSVPGTSATIFWRLCRDPQVKRFPLINVMDSIGLPGVAQAKQAYRPVASLPLISVYSR